MRDVRRKIARDLDMVDAAEMLELLVCDKIISLDLSVRQVYASVWQPGSKDARNRARRRRMGALAAALGDAGASLMAPGEEEDEDHDMEEEDEVYSEGSVTRTRTRKRTMRGNLKRRRRDSRRWSSRID